MYSSWMPYQRTSVSHGANHVLVTPTLRIGSMSPMADSSSSALRSLAARSCVTTVGRIFSTSASDPMIGT